MPDLAQDVSDALSAFLQERFPKKFDFKTWKKDKFSSYYDDVEQVRGVIDDITQQVADKNGLAVSDNDLQELAAQVTLDSAPDDLIEPMANTIA